ncbi:MAG: helix-turn-helix transcriptional regulator, partial [Promethearchaeota archaeon]
VSFELLQSRLLGMVEAVAGRDLTARELDVLAPVVDGLSNSAIAQQLCISQATDSFHVSAILSKSNPANRAAAAVPAVKHHLLD